MYRENLEYSNSEARRLRAVRGFLEGEIQVKLNYSKLKRLNVVDVYTQTQQHATSQFIWFVLKPQRKLLFSFGMWLRPFFIFGDFPNLQLYIVGSISAGKVVRSSRILSLMEAMHVA